jgi:hypothetical protein
MKNKILYKSFDWFTHFCVFCTSAFLFHACEDKNEEATFAPCIKELKFIWKITIFSTDREVNLPVLVNTISSRGSGFTGVTKVYINGYDNYFNPVFVTVILCGLPFLKTCLQLMRRKKFVILFA